MTDGHWRNYVNEVRSEHRAELERARDDGRYLEERGRFRGYLLMAMLAQSQWSTPAIPIVVLILTAWQGFVTWREALR